MLHETKWDYQIWMLRKDAFVQNTLYCLSIHYPHADLSGLFLRTLSIAGIENWKYVDTGGNNADNGNLKVLKENTLTLSLYPS
jgi:hypothetical protein